MRNVYKKSLLLFGLSYIPFVNQYGVLVNMWIIALVLISFFKEKYSTEVKNIYKICFILLSLIFIYLEFGTFRNLNSWVALFVCLAPLKIYELNDRRDFFLFCLILELVLVGSFLSINNFVMITYTLMIAFIMFCFLYEFRTTIEGQKINKIHYKKILKILLSSLPLSLVLFFIFPRVNVSSYLFNTIKSVSKTGFVEELNPGDFRSIVNSDEPIFRVFFQSSVAPSVENMYWRMSVLLTNNDFNWRRGPEQEKQDIKFKKNILYNYQVDFDNTSQSYLPVLNYTGFVRKNSKSYIVEKNGSTFKALPISNQKISFKASTFYKLRYTELKKEKRDAYLQIDDKYNPMFKAWVQNLDIKTDLDTLKKFFFSYLVKNNFEYSLDVSKTNNENNLDHFFFKYKKGYCEHYASSFAIFLRHFKIPSRVVVGFHGGSYNDFGEYYLVKSRDAHAWVEAYDEDKGWVSLDPTEAVGATRLTMGAFGFLNKNEMLDGENEMSFLNRQNNSWIFRASLIIDSLYYDLNSRFLNYDLAEQKNMLKQFGVKEKQRLKMSILVLIMLFLSFLFWKVLNSNTHYNKGHPKYWYLKFIKKMDKYNLAPGKSETPSRYLVRLEETTHEDFFETASPFVRHYIDLSFKSIECKNNMKVLFNKINFKGIK